MNPHTGNCDGHARIEAKPNANIDTAQYITSATMSKLSAESVLTKDGRIPPGRHLRVAAHEASVNVRLLVKRTTRLNPNLLPEVQDRVHNC